MNRWRPIDRMTQNLVLVSFIFIRSPFPTMLLKSTSSIVQSFLPKLAQIQNHPRRNRGPSIKMGTRLVSEVFHDLRISLCYPYLTMDRRLPYLYCYRTVRGIPRSERILKTEILNASSAKRRHSSIPFNFFRKKSGETIPRVAK